MQNIGRGGVYSVLTELLAGNSTISLAEFYVKVYYGHDHGRGQCLFFLHLVQLKYTDELKIKQIVVIIDVN